MSLFDLLPKSIFGFKGNKLPFRLDPNPPASYHDTYSADGKPAVRQLNTVPKNYLPQPSNLDEADKRNNNKYKNRLKGKYLDQNFK